MLQRYLAAEVKGLFPEWHVVYSIRESYMIRDLDVVEIRQNNELLMCDWLCVDGLAFYLLVGKGKYY